jgi:maleate cis-trans isomerase
MISVSYFIQRVDLQYECPSFLRVQLWHAASSVYSGDHSRIGERSMSFTLWRGVVGMVRPTRRPGTLEELIRILPEGIGIVPLMLNFKAGTNEEFLKSLPDYERFAAELADQKVDLIILSGAPPFMLLGPEKEAAWTQRLEKTTKTPIVTDPQMQIAGLRTMKIKKFIGASYSALQNKIVLDYMTKAGLRALSMEPIDVPFDQVSQISVEQLYSHIKRLHRKHSAADGIYIQGGGWQTARVVELLEEDLDIPVVHATICQAWQIHKHLKVRKTTPGFGRLLAELS